MERRGGQRGGWQTDPKLLATVITVMLVQRESRMLGLRASSWKSPAWECSLDLLRRVSW